MGLSATRWLIDKSALWRLGKPEVADVVEPAIIAGLVGVSVVTELEVGFSARSTADYRLMRATVMDRLIPVAFPYRAESRAREVQAALVERGEHRSAGVADVLLAATAELEGLTVWHYDSDFDLIAVVTGQEMEWVVPRGTVD
ncbi:MAG: PIN domain nuclease [Egibacteraceae bacterium]